MRRATLYPATRDAWLQLRTLDVTSTDIFSLFGDRPAARAQVWHEKFQQRPRLVPMTEQMESGLNLQPVVGPWIARRQGWSVKDLDNVYGRCPDLRIGSSFDFEIVADGGLMELKCPGENAVAKEWTLKDGQVLKAPERVELQVQHQLLVSGRPYAIIAAFWSNRGYTARRFPNQVVQDEILRRCERFWQTIDRLRPTYQTSGRVAYAV